MPLAVLLASLAACPPHRLPTTFLDDRHRLSEAFAAFDTANKLTQPAPGQSSFKGTPERFLQILQALRHGLEAGDAVSNDFLDWLHPQMRTAFREQYLAGNRLYLEGLVQHDVVKQLRGSDLVQQWYSGFWSVNSKPIADRAFMEPGTFTNVLWFSLAWILGICAGALLLVQPLIALFFGLPFTLRLKRLGVLRSNLPFAKYLGSLVLLLTVFWFATTGMRAWLPEQIVGYYIGVSVAVLFSLAHWRANPANMQDYVETNASYIDAEALKHILPDAPAK